MVMPFVHGLVQARAAALELADQDLAEIDAALSATPVRGARQSPAGLALFWGVGSMADR
jgi:hypothetical protein